MAIALPPSPINKSLAVKVVSPVPPCATGTVPLDVRFLLTSVKTKEEAVRVATFKFPKLSMLIRLVPLPFWKLAMAAVWVEVALTIRVGVVEAAEKDWT